MAKDFDSANHIHQERCLNGQDCLYWRWKHCFAKNVLGDCLLVPSLADAHISLVDIDPERLRDSEMMMHNLNRNLGGKATIEATLDSAPL